MQIFSVYTAIHGSHTLTMMIIKDGQDVMWRRKISSMMTMVKFTRATRIPLCWAQCLSLSTSAGRIHCLFESCTSHWHQQYEKCVEVKMSSYWNYIQSQNIVEMCIVVLDAVIMEVVLSLFSLLWWILVCTVLLDQGIDTWVETANWISDNTRHALYCMVKPATPAKTAK